MSLTQLTDELSKNFDECLETILSVPEQQSNEDEAQENKSNGKYKKNTRLIIKILTKNSY